MFAGGVEPISPRSVLVLGGARSGKSRFAQRLAEDSGRTPVFLATARAEDEEMKARIARHRDARGEAWLTIEEPTRLVAALAREAAPDRVLLVDCLTLWLSNLLAENDDLERRSSELAGAAPSLPGAAIFVSNEVGCGIVPENALGRSFRDAQGRLNQMMAEVCEAVVLVSAGLPLVLKPAPLPPIRLRPAAPERARSHPTQPVPSRY